MAFALIASTSESGSTNETCTTPTITTTGADLIVINVGWYSPDARTLAVSDSKSNSWTPLTERENAASGAAQQFFYSKPTTVGTNHTFTAATSSGGTPVYPSMEVFAFSGSHASPLDQQTGANGNGINSLATGSLTPSEANCLVVTGIGHDINSGGAVSVDGVFAGNALTEAYVGSTSLGSGMSYEIQTSATARNPTWSTTNNTGIAVALAVFKAAASGRTTKNTRAFPLGVELGMNRGVA